MAAPTIPATKYSAQEVLNKVFDESTSSLYTTGSGGGGGGTEYAEGATAATATGTLAMWKSGTTLTAASTAAPFPVAIISGAGSGGTASTDDSAFTFGTTNLTPVGGTYSSTRDAVDSGDTGAFAMTATRAIYASLETPAGDSVMDDTLNVVKTMIVDGAGAQITTFGGGTQYTEGDTDASITGTAMLMEGAANTLLTVPGTTADGILVNLGANNDVSVTGSVAVTGTFFQATQPVSAASLPLPSGASTSANQTTIISHLDGVEGLLTTIDADTSVLAAIDYATGADVASIAVVGGGTEATAQRVTIASDSSGVISIDDNGGSITVDGTVSITGTATVSATNLDIRDLTSVSDSVASVQSGTWNVGLSTGTNTIGSVKLTDGTTSATVRELGTNDALNVSIVDGAGDQIVTFGGGTQYTEGDVDASITGTALMWEDSGDTLRAVSSANALPVNTELPTASGLADASATPTVPAVGGFNMVYNGTTWDMARSGVTTPTSTVTGMQNTVPWAKYDTTPTARTNGQSGPLQADTNGALNVNSYTLIAGEDQPNNVMQVTQKPLAVSTYSPTLYTMLETSASASVKATPGNVFSFSVTNAATTTAYFQLFNRASAPSAALTPTYTWLLPSTGTLIIGNDFFTSAGAYFSTGIAFGISSDANTFVAATTPANHCTHIHYI